MAIAPGMWSTQRGPVVGSTVSAQGPSYGVSDPDIARQIAGQESIAKIGAEASMYPARLQQSRFNTVFPWLQGQIGDFKSTLDGSLGGTGVASGGPSIRVGGVYNPQNIQQQVNASNAKIDQATSTKNIADAQQLGSSGYGANSPLLAALKGQSFAAGLGTKTQAEQGLRTTAAAQNQQAQLASQQAAANVYAQRQAEALQKRGQNTSLYGALIGQLSGLV